MQKEWYQDLNEYIRLGEPNLEEKTVAWQTAIGLQAVDGLSTSDYLLETAKDNIEGKIIGFLYTDIFLQIYLLMLEKSEPIISVKTNGFCEGKVFFTRLMIVFL